MQPAQRSPRPTRCALRWTLTLNTVSCLCLAARAPAVNAALLAFAAAERRPCSNRSTSPARSKPAAAERGARQTGGTDGQTDASCDNMGGKSQHGKNALVQRQHRHDSWTTTPGLSHSLDNSDSCPSGVAHFLFPLF